MKFLGKEKLIFGDTHLEEDSSFIKVDMNKNKNVKVVTSRMSKRNKFKDNCGVSNIVKRKYSKWDMELEN